MENLLARTFDFKTLICFALPNIFSMMFMALYSIVDAFFVANFVDQNAMSAVNVVFPMLNVELALSTMMGLRLLQSSLMRGLFLNHCFLDTPLERYLWLDSSMEWAMTSRTRRY